MHFLHSTISISDKSFKDKNSANILSDSDSEYNPRVYNREKIEYTIYSSEDLVLKATNTFFVECTEPLSGGAIDMICEESSLIISKCCFVSCFAQTQGGAISFFGNIFKVNNTCFDGCYTMDSAMSMELYVKGSKEKISLSRLSITNCADKKLFISKRKENPKTDRMQDFDGMGQFGVYLSNVIDMNRGKQKLSAINSTNNIVHLGGGFCISDESKSFSLSYSTIVNNIADVLFNLYDINFNNGNISYCNVLNNTASLSLTLFDLENSSVDVSYTTFLQNNLTFVASNGNLRLENCAYDFNSKAPPLENAEFNEIGSILHKLKNWRSAKTVAFDQEQVDNNDKIFNRCRKNKPRYSRNEQIFHQQFNGFNDNFNRNNRIYNDDDDDSKKNNKENDDIFNNKNENIDNALKKFKNNKNIEDEEDEDTKDTKDKHKNYNIYRNNNDLFNNKNDNNDDIFNNKNDNKNDNKNRNNKNDEDEDDDDNKKNHNNLNHFVKNQIKIDDNEEDEHDEENKAQNNKTNEHSNDHSRTGLLICVFILMIAGISVFIYIYFIKDKERDINQLQDVELL